MKRIARIVAGISLIVIGVALLVLPGPGIITILGGVTLLATEFTWASVIKEWAKEKTARLRGEPERERSSETPSSEVDEWEDQTG